MEKPSFHHEEEHAQVKHCVGPTSHTFNPDDCAEHVTAIPIDGTPCWVLAVGHTVSHYVRCCAYKDISSKVFRN